MSWQKDNIWLVDVAHHQGSVDFEALAKSGCSAVIMKATEGRDYVDPRFRENWERACDVMPFVGVYHYGRIDTDHTDPMDARAEAQHLARTLESVSHVRGILDDGMLMPWLDSEWFGSLDDVNRNLDWSGLWIETCEAELGRSPGIYTGADAWQSRWGSSSRFAHLPLWQADHARSAGRPEPMRLDWKPSIHQFSARQYVDGIKARVDANVVVPGFEITDRTSRLAYQMAELDRLARLRLIERPTAPTALAGLATCPVFDLADLPTSKWNEAVARVQGLLLSHGYGPTGLTNSVGMPDGKPGPKTREALADFRRTIGLAAGTVVDGETWHRLLAIEVEQLFA